MRVRRVGADALLIEVDDPAAWFTELCRRRDRDELRAVEIVPGARTVLLDGVTDPTATAEALTQWRTAPAGESPGAGAEVAVPVVVPVIFDGPDLDEVAAMWGVDPGEVAGRLQRIPWRVAFCGFAPGFAYLAGLPYQFAVPRLPTPRAKVPAGSVGLADRYAGVYPGSSPGGWRLVGRTELTLFDPARTPPALLTPGARVRFEAAS